MRPNPATTVTRLLGSGGARKAENTLRSASAGAIPRTALDGVDGDADLTYGFCCRCNKANVVGCAPAGPEGSCPENLRSRTAVGHVFGEGGMGPMVAKASGPCSWTAPSIQVRPASRLDEERGRRSSTKPRSRGWRAGGALKSASWSGRRGGTLPFQDLPSRLPPGLRRPLRGPAPAPAIGDLHALLTPLMVEYRLGREALEPETPDVMMQENGTGCGRDAGRHCRGLQRLGRWGGRCHRARVALEPYHPTFRDFVTRQDGAG